MIKEKGWEEGTHKVISKSDNSIGTEGSMSKVEILTCHDSNKTHATVTRNYHTIL